jgi:hypothetical protein
LFLELYRYQMMCLHKILFCCSSYE